MTTALTLTPANQELVTGQVQEGLTQLMVHKKLIEQVVGQMEENRHFGASFPGDKKMNLLKPGADYLGVAFKLVPEFTQTEKDLGAGHREYSTVCVIKTSDGARIVANGVGTCSTMEKKYRWRNETRKCPACGAAAIMKGKKEYDRTGGEGGWLCWKNNKTTPGCGATFADNDQRVVGQQVGKIENEDIADVWNTVMKISKKRAYVDAIITATGCSDQFTQDAEDHAGGYEETKTSTTGGQGGTGAPAATPAAAATSKPAAEVVDEKKKAPDPADRLFEDFDSAISNALDPKQLGDIWKEVMSQQKGISRAHMIKLRDKWQARLQGEAMKAN